MVVFESYISYILAGFLAIYLYRKDRQAFLVGGIVTGLTCGIAYMLVSQISPDLLEYTLLVAGLSAMFSGYLASHFRAERILIDAVADKV